MTRNNQAWNRDADEPPIVGGRVPPNDMQSEAAVLSASMLSADAAVVALEILTRDDFYSANHGVIFGAIASLAKRGQPIDVVNVAKVLRDEEHIQAAGGVAYLGELLDATPAVANVATHAMNVREKARLRKVIAVCQKYAGEGYGVISEGDEQAFIALVESEISKLAHVQSTSEPEDLSPILTRAFTKLQEATERGDVLTGEPTGFRDLDQKTAGLHPGDLMIVAARPGMGKTSLVLRAVVSVASERTITGHPSQPGKGAAVFSLEMPKEQVAMRMLCCEAKVNVGGFRNGHLHAEDWSKLVEAGAWVAKLPIKVDDTGGITLLELRSKLTRIRADFEKQGIPLGVVVIDYLQLMSGRKGAQNREQEISEISRGLKQMAKDFGVPVIALSQLNRSVETRGTDNKRPMLSDLRESGAIEQDADTIVFIYRDDYYRKKDSPEPGIAELIIAKQRNGPTGTVRVRFIDVYTRFQDLEPGEYEEFEEFA